MDPVDPLDPTINGHPAIYIPNAGMITLCAECGEMKSILFLSKDRWFCWKCKNEGVANPTIIPLTSKRRRW